MKALVRRGRHRGSEVTISQWCNDWFTIDEDPQVYSPTSLVFTSDDMFTIINHHNNGIMFSLFEACMVDNPVGEYVMTFKRRKRL